MRKLTKPLAIAITAAFGIGAAASCGGDQSAAPADTSAVAADTAAVITPDTVVPADTVEPAPDTATPAPDTVEPVDTAPAPDTKPVSDTLEPVDTAPAVDTEPAVDTVTPPPAEVRFVVLGDTGTGSDTQKQVAGVVKSRCDALGCDFALMVGDNIYDAGVTSVMDAQWQEKFEGPYAAIDMPFYAVLGNHDNGGFLSMFLGDTFAGAGAEFERGDVEVQYTQMSTKWRMPARYYDFAAGPAHFFALDTNDFVWSYGNPIAEQRSGIQVDTQAERIDDAEETWRVAFGHHPFISNGRHGDAGAYEGLEEGITDLLAALPFVGNLLGDLQQVVTGDGVQEALDTLVCGNVDLYFAGHDHDRQWLVPIDDCPGTTFVVSGAGSKLTAHGAKYHPVLFEDYDREGFFWVRLVGNRLEAKAFDKDGNEQWSTEYTK